MKYSKIKRRISVILCVVMAGLLLVACTNASKTAEIEPMDSEEIDNYSGTITWKVRHNIVSGTNNDFKLFLEQCSNQTRELYNAYSQFGNYEKVKMLDEVNIMTPENIHLNSFMYEPILDMDINELLNLYQRVKSL